MVSWPPRTSKDVTDKIDGMDYRVREVDSGLTMLLRHVQERTLPSPWVLWWFQTLLLVGILIGVWK